jgi:hypothetical protein
VSSVRYKEWRPFLHIVSAPTASFAD